MQAGGQVLSFEWGQKARPDPLNHELINRRAPWKTKEAVEFATLQWVAWFNQQRLLEPIGYIPPAEAEENYYRQLACQTTAVAV
jgi:putative transposase